MLWLLNYISHITKELPMSFEYTRPSGWAPIAGGALLTIAGPLLDIARFGEPDANTTLVRAAQLLFVASIPGLLGGVRALVALQWAGSRVTQIGRALAYAGLAASALGSLLFAIRPTEVQFLNPIGSVLLSVGMLVLGSVMLRNGTLPGGSRWLPLLIGGWFFAHLPVQFAFFASPRGVPSHTFMCLVWGPLWALLGAALLQYTRVNLMTQER
jgi:hypothetical protein